MFVDNICVGSISQHIKKTFLVLLAFHIQPNFPIFIYGTVKNFHFNKNLKMHKNKTKKLR